MSHQSNEKPTQSNTTSVPDVTSLYALDLNDQFDTVNQKCTKCNTVTEHEWTKIQPQPLFDEQRADPMALLKLIKRIIMCTHCGQLSLKD